jgi:hypothetical protein
MPAGECRLSSMLVSSQVNSSAHDDARRMKPHLRAVACG